MKTTKTAGRTLHSYLCEALGCEDQDTTRPFAAPDTRTDAERMAALDAIKIDLRPRSKRR